MPPAFFELRNALKETAQNNCHMDDMGPFVKVIVSGVEQMVA